MKRIKCPLCGHHFKLDDTLCRKPQDVLSNFAGPTVYFCRCEGCGLSIGPYGSPASAWDELEEFIAKFPPIMRVSPGDKVIIGPNYVESITAVNREGGYMKFGEGGHIAFPMDVAEWPWELEQKEKK